MVTMNQKIRYTHPNGESLILSDFMHKLQSKSEDGEELKEEV